MIFFQPPFFLNSHWSMIATSLLRGPIENGDRALAPPTRPALDTILQEAALPSDPKVEMMSAPPAWLRDATPRHIIFVSLETAIEKYYPIIDNPDYPNFYRMGQNAIVSEKHLTAALLTAQAGFSMLTGLYTTANTRFTASIPDALPNFLGRLGYTTTYIDSGVLDWRGGDAHRRMYSTAGMENLIEASSVPDLWENRQEYDTKIELEKWAFDLAAQSLIEADAQGQKALVFLQSTLGHFPWPARQGDQRLGSVARIHKVAGELDSLMGQLLKQLEGAGLGEDVVIVVTGDHGLRYRGEFESLDLRLSVRDVAFNVPLLIYAPGLIEETLALPHVTSHIDIAPTVLELIGLPTDGLLYHGMSMFDPQLAMRVTFMMPSGLSPVSGYYWQGLYFTYNNLTFDSLVSQDFKGPDSAVHLAEEGAKLGIPEALQQAPTFVQEAARSIDLTHLYLETVEARIAEAE